MTLITKCIVGNHLPEFLPKVGVIGDRMLSGERKKYIFWTVFFQRMAPKKPEN